MHKTDDALLLYRVAKDYYLNDMNQEEISKREHISRSQISRMLKKARELGIVNINIKIPNIVDREDLEVKLREKLGLQKVIVAPSGTDDDENDAMMWTMAAEYLSNALESCKNVGIGWGKAVYRTSFLLQFQSEHPELTFYPIVGNSGVDKPILQTDNISARFADKFQARSYFTSSLIISPRRYITDIEKERLLKLRSHWNNLDAIVLGVGGSLNHGGIYIEELPREIFSDEILSNLIGDIICNFVLKDGTMLQVPSDYETVIIDLKSIRRTPNVICIANGRSKVDIIKYSAEHGYINTLITDSDTALAILE